VDRLLSHAQRRTASEVAITIACAVVMAGTVVVVALAVYASLRGHTPPARPARLLPSVSDCFA
jgi:hypothetical protein